LRNRIGRSKKNLHCKTLNYLQANLYTIRPWTLKTKNFSLASNVRSRD
jgi:hypothetical protein